MGKDKRDKLILALVIVVLVLLAVVGYIFLIKPAISGFVVSSQTQGVQYAILSIMQQAAKCDSSGVPLTYQNQTIHLVALECYKSAPAATK